MTLRLRDHPVSRTLELHGYALYEKVQRIRMIQMRREWFLETGSLLKEVTPTMLDDYGIDPWCDTMFGMRCVPSPITIVGR